MTDVLVFVGGEPTAPPDPLPTDRYVIAADGGLGHAHQLGITVDRVVGDMDSVNPLLLAEAEAAGAVVERYPTDKDATDLELALAAAAALAPDRIVLVGGVGGRVDHLLANALLLASPRWTECDIEWRIGGAVIIPVRGRTEIAGGPGDLLTLMAVGGAVTGIKTEGLEYALDGDSLEPFSTRGVSNRFLNERVIVSVAEGVLLAVHEPGG